MIHKFKEYDEDYISYCKEWGYFPYLDEYDCGYKNPLWWTYKKKRTSLNRKYISCYCIPVSEDGMEEFNFLYKKIKEYNFSNTVFTESGGISIKGTLKRKPQYYVLKSNGCIELGIVAQNKAIRFQFRHPNEKNGDKITYSGWNAWCDFKKILAEHGIDINDYAVDNGLELKKQVPKYKVKLISDSYKDKVFYNAYHIDLNSAFLSGILFHHQEMGEALRDMYYRRYYRWLNGEIIYKEDGTPWMNDKIKQMINDAIGMMHSVPNNGAKWANLAIEAISWTNNELQRLYTELVKNFYTPIAFNTDGIWYVDNNDLGPYHDEFEGTELGQWKTDHKKCQIRFKGPRSYEWIEDGVYHVKMSGKSSYEMVVPREKWQWGDIYKGSSIKYRFDDEFGIIKEEENV